MWINNRRDALKTNITRFVSEIARAAGCPSALAAIESALNLLLRLAENSASTAFNHLHAKHRLRPTTLTLTLSSPITFRAFLPGERSDSPRVHICARR